MKLRTYYDQCPYITAGKVYEVVEFDFIYPDSLADILADDGSLITVLLSAECPHLDDVGYWHEVDENGGVKV